MDPDEVLKKIRMVLIKVQTDTFVLDDAPELLEDLAESVENLDAWLTKGGFLPQPWQH